MLPLLQGAAAAAAEASASAKTVDDAAKKSFEFWQVKTKCIDYQWIVSSIFLRRIMVLDLSTNLLQQDILSSSKSAAFFPGLRSRYRSWTRR